MTMIRISLITIITMMTIFALTIASTAIAGEVPVPRENPQRVQSSGPECGPTQQMLNELRADFGETPVVVGLIYDQQHIMTITVDGDGGTWTALVSSPDGHSCIVAHGDNYVEREANPGQPT